MKKILLSIGTIATVAAPIAAVISCGAAADKQAGTATDGQHAKTTTAGGKIIFTLPTTVDPVGNTEVKVDPVVEPEAAKPSKPEIIKNPVVGLKVDASLMKTLGTIGGIVKNYVQFQRPDSKRSSHLGSAWEATTTEVDGREVTFNYQEINLNGWGYRQSAKVSLNVDTGSLHDFQVYYEKWEGCQVWIKNPSILQNEMDKDISIFNPQALIDEMKVLDGIIIAPKADEVDGVLFDDRSIEYPTYSKPDNLNTIPKIQAEEIKKEAAADAAEVYNEAYAKAAAKVKVVVDMEASMKKVVADSGTTDIWKFLASDLFVKTVEGYAKANGQTNVDKFIANAIKELEEDKGTPYSTVENYIKQNSFDKAAFEILNTIYKSLGFTREKDFPDTYGPCDITGFTRWGDPRRATNFWAWALKVNYPL